MKFDANSKKSLSEMPPPPWLNVRDSTNRNIRTITTAPCLSGYKTYGGLAYNAQVVYFTSNYMLLSRCHSASISQFHKIVNIYLQF